jgi:deoxyribonuclease IV
VKIGAHMKVAGGLNVAIDRAIGMEVEAMQIFLSGPQTWKPPKLEPEDVALYREKLEASGIDPVYLHCVYLINLGSKDQVIVNRSIGSLKQYLKGAAAIGARGGIFHVGSHLGSGFDATAPQVIAAMTNVLEATPDDIELVIENNAGQGGGIGSHWEEIGYLIREIGSPRVKVCFDTCHAFAMGYDVASKEGCQIAMAGFEKEIGFDRLVAVHANDSKMPLGGTRDRHENIGEGHIGLDGFRCLMAHPAFADLPFFLEVPGFDGEGPDARNVQILKDLRKEVLGY